MSTQPQRDHGPHKILRKRLAKLNARRVAHARTVSNGDHASQRAATKAPGSMTK